MGPRKALKTKQPLAWPAGATIGGSSLRCWSGAKNVLQAQSMSQGNAISLQSLILSLRVWSLPTERAVLPAATLEGGRRRCRWAGLLPLPASSQSRPGPTPTPSATLVQREVTQSPHWQA